MAQKASQVKLQQQGAPNQKHWQEIPVNVGNAQYTVQQQKHIAEPEKHHKRPHFGTVGLGTQYTEKGVPARKQPGNQIVDNQNRTDCHYAPQRILQQFIHRRFCCEGNSADQDHMQRHCRQMSEIDKEHFFCAAILCLKQPGQLNEKGQDIDRRKRNIHHAPDSKQQHSWQSDSQPIPI